MIDLRLISCRVVAALGRQDSLALLLVFRAR